MLPKLGTQKNGHGGNGTIEMYIIFIRNATFFLLWGSPNNSKAISSGIGKIIKGLSGNSEAGSHPLVLNLFLYAELKESLCACPLSALKQSLNLTRLRQGFRLRSRELRRDKSPR